MTDVAFYHLQRSPLEAGAAEAAGEDAGGRTSAPWCWPARRSGSRRWPRTCGPTIRHSWLPHGTAQDGSAEEQPIWLTDSDENPNGAAFLFL